MRRRNAQEYNNQLNKIRDITLPNAPEGFYHVYQKYTIKIKNGQRDKLIDHLKNKGIFSKAYFGLPVHLTKFYREKFGYNEGDLPVTEELSKQVLTLPLFPALKKQEIEYITESIKEFFLE